MPRKLEAPARPIQRVKTTQAREEFGTIINTVAYGGQWIVFERRGRDMAAMIPIADLQRLQAYDTDGQAQPGWDGVHSSSGSYDWAAAERVRRSLEEDYMH